MTKTPRSFTLPRATWATLPLLCAALAIPAHAQTTSNSKPRTAQSTKKPVAKAAAKPATQSTAKPASAAAAASAASAPLAATSGPRAPVANAGPREADYIVAVVNSEPVTNNEVRTRAARLQQQLIERGATPPSPDALRKEVLERLISERAQLQYARETGI